MPLNITLKKPKLHQEKPMKKDILADMQKMESLEKTPVTAKKAEEKSAADIAPKNAKERYLDRLKEANITLSEAQRIIDALLTDFYYEEDFTLAGRVQVTLKTRTAGQVAAIQKRIKLARVDTENEYRELNNRWNLIYSLKRYGSHELDCSTDEGVDQAASLVEQLPLPLYNALVNKLAALDLKLAYVTSEGGLENF